MVENEIGRDAKNIIKCWRPSAKARLGYYAVATFLLVVVGALLRTAVQAQVFNPYGLLLIPIFVAPAVFAIRRARTSISLTESELIVKNTFVTKRLLRKDILSASAGYNGVRVRTSEETITAVAIEKANLSTWTRTHTECDRVVTAIYDWVGIPQPWP